MNLLEVSLLTLGDFLRLWKTWRYLERLGDTWGDLGSWEHLRRIGKMLGDLGGLRGT